MTLVMPLHFCFLGVMHLHIKIIVTEMNCFNKFEWTKLSINTNKKKDYLETLKGTIVGQER